MNRSSEIFDSSSDSFASVHDDDHLLLATAVRLLQAHERARQGREHAYQMLRMREESTKTDVETVDQKSFEESALIIQTVWRQKHAEKLFEERKLEESRLLGMVKKFQYFPRCRRSFSSKDFTKRNDRCGIKQSESSIAD